MNINVTDILHYHYFFSHYNISHGCDVLELKTLGIIILFVDIVVKNYSLQCTLQCKVIKTQLFSNLTY